MKEKGFRNDYDSHPNAATRESFVHQHNERFANLNPHKTGRELFARTRRCSERACKETVERETESKLKTSGDERRFSSLVKSKEMKREEKNDATFLPGNLIAGFASIGHQKSPERRFVSKSYSGPMKLKFRKRTVSEKDILKNGHIPTKCKSRRCLLKYHNQTSQHEMDVL
ncbi:hypothetical protein TNCV_2532941 [Trichonephila clavipes]|nr:hypothetical protein TNCV_2532941 [Trichonephila clavipes]